MVRNMKEAGEKWMKERIKNKQERMNENKKKWTTEYGLKKY